MTASQIAVALLKAGQDKDMAFCRKAASMLLDGQNIPDLTHIIAVQNVWLLEQMHYIEQMTGGDMTTDGQIEDLGINVALRDVFGDYG